MEDNTLVTPSANSFNCSTLCTGRSDYIAGTSALEREEEEEEERPKSPDQR